MSGNVIEIGGVGDDESLAARAAGVVREGGVLIHPTATIHGFGCRFDMNEPVERIRKIKGRGDDKPMILLIPSDEWLERICAQVPVEASSLAREFWPGGLSLVLEASEWFRAECSWPARTVAVRRCAHPFIGRMMAVIDLPMVSTSLGYSGEPLPADSLAFARGLVEGENAPRDIRPEMAVIDPDLDRSTRKASTIVDLSTPGTCRLLREGAVAAERIRRVCDLDTGC